MQGRAAALRLLLCRRAAGCGAVGVSAEDAIHDGGAVFDDRAQLLAIDGLGDVDPPACPTRRAICSMGTPASESTDTKLWRSSRGVQSAASSPAAAATRRNPRRTLAESSGVPVAVAKTRSLSIQRSPAARRAVAWRSR